MDSAVSTLDTVFLDVGNTLVSMDFALIARAVGERGLEISPDALREAEPRARPAVSAFIRELGSTERDGVFGFYLERVLAEARVADAAARAREIVPAIEALPTQQLWCAAIPGAAEGLAALRELGLRLVAVSNSDGTAAESLRRAGLFGFLDDVHDSHIVGFEKPDRRIFEHAIAAAGTVAERCIHVGDIYDADVVGARAAGIRPVLVDPADVWPDADCLRVRDMPALAAWLGAGGAPA